MTDHSHHGHDPPGHGPGHGHEGERPHDHAGRPGPPRLPPHHDEARPGEAHHFDERSPARRLEHAGAGSPPATLAELAAAHLDASGRPEVHPALEIPGRGVFDGDLHPGAGGHDRPGSTAPTPGQRLGDSYASSWALDPLGAGALADSTPGIPIEPLHAPVGGASLDDAISSAAGGHPSVVETLWSAYGAGDPPRDPDGTPAAPVKVLEELSERVSNPMARHVIELALEDARRV